MEIGNIVIGGMQEHQAIKTDGICTCLTSSMGTGGGYVPMVVDIRKVDIVNDTNKSLRAEQLSCVKQIGNVTPNNWGDNANQGRVYDTDYLAPCLNSMQGGGRQPHIVECVCLGGFGEKKSNGGTQWYQQDRICQMGDVSMCLPSQLPGGSYNYLEVKKMGTKDGCNMLGTMELNGSLEIASRVYGSDGLCPCQNAHAGDTVPKFLEVKKMDSQIVAMRGRDKDNPSHRGCSNENYEQRLEPNANGICNTITSVQKDNLVLEKKSIKIRQATKEGFIDCELPGVADLNYTGSKTRRGRVVDGGQISPTLTTENIPSVIELADPGFYNFLYEIDGEVYLIRIRKLIPLECWRLMGFTDEDFCKAKYMKEIFYLEGGNSECNVKLKAVAENQRQLNTETCVLCTTKELQDTEILKMVCEEYQRMPESEKNLNVSIVTEKSEKMGHLGCAANIIKCGTFMGMHFTLMEGKDQNHMVISVQVKMENMNTEKCMKIITESNLQESKLYTILTLLKLITESKIFISSTLEVNIQGVISISENCKKNIQMNLLNLEMEHITERSSNTVLYKQAGNSIAKNCLIAIFGQMFEGKENVYKTL